MASLFHRFYEVLREQGLDEATRRGLEFALRRLYFTVSDNPQRMYVDAMEAIAARRNINICYNKWAKDQYDESMTNVLIATESPAVVEHENWLDPSMDFHAEFSYGNYYGLDNFYSLRRWHAGNDYWAELDLSNDYADKDSLVSTILSEKDKLPGQTMRHRVSSEFGDVVDCYGSGVDRFIENKTDSLDSYMFQIVIENGKYSEYVSEKFFDCLKTNTIPIYRGARDAVETMDFDTDGVLFFDEFGELETILDEISPEMYRLQRPAVERNRDRLVTIRNELRNEFYMSHIRPGSLRDNDDRSYVGKSKLRYE